MRKTIGFLLSAFIAATALAQNANTVNQVVAPLQTVNGGTGATSLTGLITLGDQANLAAQSIQCNSNVSAASPQACTPAQVNLLTTAGFQVTAAGFAAPTGTQPSIGAPVTWTASLSSGATSATATVATALANGTYPVIFADGELRYATVTTTGGTTTVSWATGLANNSAVSPNRILGGIVTAVDGVTLTAGQNVAVFGSGVVGAGIWQVSSTAWSRVALFPAAFVFPINCTVSVSVLQGTLLGGSKYVLSVTSAVTVDTTAQTWTYVNSSQSASPTVPGIVEITGLGLQAVGLFGTITSVGDCPSFETTGGNIQDSGNQGLIGPCITGDAHGHVVTVGSPTVTGSGCSASTGTGLTLSDQSGSIVATGADTCTLTFGLSWSFVPFCVVSGYSSTVLPIINTAPTTTAVVFHTAAAGTFSYYCST